MGEHTGIESPSPDRVSKMILVACSDWTWQRVSAHQRAVHGAIPLRRRWRRPSGRRRRPGPRPSCPSQPLSCAWASPASARPPPSTPCLASLRPTWAALSPRPSRCARCGTLHHPSCTICLATKIGVRVPLSLDKLSW